MAKKQQQNKIGESFEQHLPDELVPDFIWNNISSALDKAPAMEESTEKIKSSFEKGFEQEALPVFLWDNIESSLNHASFLEESVENENKIKASFEEGFQDTIPDNLWENVENQLEIEGVWQRVLKRLNKNTRRRYWQEKGMQLGILALAVLLLRGCDFGQWSTITPIAQKVNVSTQTTSSTTPPFVSNKKVKNGSENHSSNSIAPTKNPKLSDASHSLIDNTSSLTSSKETTITNTITNNPTSVAALSKSKNHHPFDNLSKGSIKPSVTAAKQEKQDITAPNHNNQPYLEPITNKAQGKSDQQISELQETASLTQQSPRVPLNNNKTSDLSSIKASTTPANNYNSSNSTNSTPTPSALLSQAAIATLTNKPFVDSSIQVLQDFHIKNILNKKKHQVRFEVGMNGKIGTSLLLGNATSKGMETTSMTKTKTRVAGGIGIIVNSYLTANDAIVFGAYPLSNSQQYFGGYTNEGRYYHKEVKLAYFDFTLGYQRVLVHYNDFGTIPSSIYARIDYGLGYLSKSEEIVNGLASELGDAYNKLNHNIGLTIGNTHRINRFVIDYGLYGNLGLSAVLNFSPSGTNTIEYSNLATMGGYVGLRYVL
ncbi:hypothetical protein [Aureispira sp. CCB-E]|uniref:hypothetical protein n=1 Tax=Aureispira sp. CCB-E TaxID=3051121 RepID=UPI002868D50B|nr:hypothetical protein [Aureispira sp. CCB-E]WMX14602.1 hypothetical protein QP953_27470 [Aureispira sp. CCB-E]